MQHKGEQIMIEYVIIIWLNYPLKNLNKAHDNKPDQQDFSYLKWLQRQ